MILPRPYIYTLADQPFLCSALFIYFSRIIIQTSLVQGRSGEDEKNVVAKQLVQKSSLQAFQRFKNILFSSSFPSTSNFSKK